MKYFRALIVFCALLQSGIYAQTKQSGFFKDSQYGYYISPGFGMTQMDRSTAALFSIRAGLTIDDRFAFGPYYNVSLNEIYPQSENLPDVYMDYWTVGGFAEYALFSGKRVHLTFPLFVGYGEVEMDNEAGNAGLAESGFIQFEPSAMFEINIHSNVRINLGTGYRIVGPMEYRNFNQTDISGFTGYIGLKIGLF